MVQVMSDLKHSRDKWMWRLQGGRQSLITKWNRCNLFILIHNQKIFWSIWWWKYDVWIAALPPSMLLSNLSHIGKSYFISNSQLGRYVKWCWSFLCVMSLPVTVSFGRREPCSRGGLGCLIGRPMESLVPKATVVGFLMVPSWLGPVPSFHAKEK